MPTNISCALAPHCVNRHFGLCPRNSSVALGTLAAMQLAQLSFLILVPVYPNARVRWPHLAISLPLRLPLESFGPPSPDGLFWGTTPATKD